MPPAAAVNGGPAGASRLAPPAWRRLLGGVCLAACLRSGAGDGAIPPVPLLAGCRGACQTDSSPVPPIVPTMQRRTFLAGSAVALSAASTLRAEPPKAVTDFPEDAPRFKKG